MGEEEKKTLGVFYYKDAKGDWHPVGATKPIDLTAFTIEDLWQPTKESLPPESGMYIITVADADLPFNQWPVQIGYFQSHDLVIGDGTIENALGEWYNVNQREVRVTAWLPLPEPYREEGDE